MIDHLISFPTEADAKAHPALSPWLNEGAWDASCVFIVELVTADAVYEGETLVSPRAVFPGFWLCISTREPDPRLTEIEPCRVVADRDAASRGEQFILPVGFRASPENLAAVMRIDGVPAGSEYRFGVTP